MTRRGLGLNSGHGSEASWGDMLDPRPACSLQHEDPVVKVSPCALLSLFFYFFTTQRNEPLLLLLDSTGVSMIL